MTRYLLDTNVVSDAIKPRPAPALSDWLAGRRSGDLHISTISLGELQRGILQLPHGARREGLHRWYDGADGPPARFKGRILVFNEAAAGEWAALMADGSNAGAPRSPIDMMIAAVARVHDCVLVTLNQRHFAGIVELVEWAE